MKKHILFVDDDPNVIQGLRLRMRKQRQRWDATFVDSGEEALRELSAGTFDVVVSDMRMPGMDGASLLRTVRDIHPGVVRIILSGQASDAVMLQALAVAHEFLPKPVEPGLLERVLERLVRLEERIGDPAVRRAVGRTDTLPAQPKVYSRLLGLLAEDAASAAQVSEVLLEDAALCAQILHIANSAFFRRSRPILEIEEAVIYLGLTTIRHLALAAEVFREDAPAAPDVRRALSDLQTHAIDTAAVAWELLDTPREKEAAYVAGLLHDVGKLLMTLELPARLTEAREAMRTHGVPLHEAEQAAFSVTHAEIGAYLLGLWQLPLPIVEAVANHHTPATVGSDHLDIVTAVHAADVLVDEAGEGDTGEPGDSAGALDEAHLERLGLLDELPRWRELAEAQVSRDAR